MVDLLAVPDEGYEGQRCGQGVDHHAQYGHGYESENDRKEQGPALGDSGARQGPVFSTGHDGIDVTVNDMVDRGSSGRRQADARQRPRQQQPVDLHR